eukprot:827882-Prymnesium_polylepis.2
MCDWLHLAEVARPCVYHTKLLVAERIGATQRDDSASCWRTVLGKGLHAQIVVCTTLQWSKEGERLCCTLPVANNEL